MSGWSAHRGMTDHPDFATGFFVFGNRPVFQDHNSTHCTSLAINTPALFEINARRRANQASFPDFRCPGLTVSRRYGTLPIDRDPKPNKTSTDILWRGHVRC